MAKMHWRSIDRTGKPSEGSFEVAEGMSCDCLSSNNLVDNLLCGELPILVTSICGAESSLSFPFNGWPPVVLNPSQACAPFPAPAKKRRQTTGPSFFKSGPKNWTKKWNTSV